MRKERSRISVLKIVPKNFITKKGRKEQAEGNEACSRMGPRTGEIEVG